MRKKQRSNRREKRAADTAVSSTVVFKWLTVIALLVYVVLLLIYLSGSTRSFADVAEGVEAGLPAERLERQNEQALKRFYRLNSADYDGAALYLSRDSISAEEVLLLEVKNDRQIRDVQDAIQERIDSRKESFAAIAPEQVDVLEKSQVFVRGRFVFFAASEDAQEYLDLFTESL